MKVLITGAAGFIGSDLALRLLERGDRVIGIDNLNDYYDPALKRARLERLQQRDGFGFHRLDLADRQRAVAVARQLAALGFEIFCTRGTCRSIAEAGIGCSVVNKVKEGRPHIVDMIKNDDFTLIINTGMLALTAAITDNLSIDNFWSALLGAIIISIVSSVLGIFVRDD